MIVRLERCLSELESYPLENVECYKVRLAVLMAWDRQYYLWIRQSELTTLGTAKVREHESDAPLGQGKI